MKNNSGDKDEKNVVHFVYLGKKLPKYAWHSLNFNLRSSSSNLVLIANASINRGLELPGVTLINVEDFYHEETFKNLIKKSIYTTDFRDGFWLRTLERFFVIEQYMKNKNVEYFFHAELDQLLFRTDLLIEKLTLLSKVGVFMPYHTHDHACASIFFCNNVDVLSGFIKFVNETKTITSDMRLFADWALMNPNLMHVLPTIPAEVNFNGFRRGIKSKIVEHKQIDGFTDAMQIGQWVGGEDPRNVPIKQIPNNHFVEERASKLFSVSEFRKIKLKIQIDGSLELNFAGTVKARLYNLHLHSKIHPWLNHDKKNLFKLIESANSEVNRSIPTARRIQLIYYLLNGLKIVLRDPKSFILRKFNTVLRKLNYKNPA